MPNFSEPRTIRSGLRDLQLKLAELVRSGLKGRSTPLSEHQRAREIQLSLLPREIPQIEGFQIACGWQPSRSVSGDYFDVLPLARGRVGLCIADVAGKGAASALLMADLQASVRELVCEDLSPALLCSRLNCILCDKDASGRFVTFFYAVLDEESRAIRYESAGHCRPLLIRSGGAVEIPEASSGVLGLFSHWTYSDHQLALNSGDLLVIISDGVLDAWNREEEEFGYRRLIGSVLATRHQGADEVRKRVLADLAAFCDGKFRDDASLIVVAAK